MMRKIALATIFGLAGIGMAMAQGGPARNQNKGTAGGNRPAMVRQGMMAPMGQNDQGPMTQNQTGQTGQGPMMQNQQGNRMMMMQGRVDDRLETICQRGEEEVARLKQRNAPQELIDLIDRQKTERCEMAKRHIEERRTLMEKLRAERQQNGGGQDLPPVDGDNMMPPPPANSAPQQ